MLRKILLVIGGFWLLVTAGFLAWAFAASPAAPAARQALVSDSLVQVRTGNWLVFAPDGEQPETGLIFYPGGRVDHRAYAPFARAVAERGYLVVVVKMPLNLAVTNPNAAEAVMRAYPQVARWAIGGHSLGGAMAASFAANHREAVAGLLLLAAYPSDTDNLSAASLPVVSIYGTQDGLATPQKIDASRLLLPPATRYVAIEGGNHAQFGDYGEQSGDLPAAIAPAEQQAQVVAATVALLAGLER